MSTSASASAESKPVGIGKGSKQPDMGKSRRTSGVMASHSRQPKMYGKGRSPRSRMTRRFEAA